MAIGVSSGLIHIPFGERPSFGSPYPEGMAVGHIDVVGDASGDPITAVFLADGGFLYRMELCQASRTDFTSNTMSCITSHRWATDRSGLGAGAFDLTWITPRNESSFQLFTLRAEDLAQIRRFPMGRTDDVTLQTVFSWQSDNNTNTIAYDFDVVLTYWRVEAMFLTGFLAAFWESPLVVPPLPGVR